MSNFFQEMFGESVGIDYLGEVIEVDVEVATGGQAQDLALVLQELLQQVGFGVQTAAVLLLVDLGGRKLVGSRRRRWRRLVSISNQLRRFHLYKNNRLLRYTAVSNIVALSTILRKVLYIMKPSF